MNTLLKWVGAISIGLFFFTPVSIGLEIPLPPIKVVRALEEHRLDHFEVEKKTGLQALELLWKRVGIEFSPKSSVVLRHEKTRFSSKELRSIDRTIDLRAKDKTGWEVFLVILESLDWHYRIRLEGFFEICMWKGENLADWSSVDDAGTKEAFAAVIFEEISIPGDLRLAISQLGNAIRKSRQDFKYDIYLDIDFVYYSPKDLSQSFYLLDVGKLQNVSAETVVEVIAMSGSFRAIWKDDGVYFISK